MAKRGLDPARAQKLAEQMRKKHLQSLGYATTIVKQPQARAGFTSVARTRGAAVTGEMKYYDCEYNAVAVGVTTTTWVAGTLADPTASIDLGDPTIATPGCLCAPKASAALNGRIGRMIKLMKVKVNGEFVTTTLAAKNVAQASTMIRLILVLDKQTNSAAMTAANLMNNAGFAATTINSFQNPNNFGRFQVLKEKRFNLCDPNLSGSPTTGDVISGSKTIHWKMSYDLKGLPAHFNATNGGTVADIVDNSLHIIAACNNNALAPFMSYYSRVSYKE